VSRRQRRPAGGVEGAESREEGRPIGSRGETRSAGAPATGARPTVPPHSERRPSHRLLTDLAILSALFAVTVGVAELAGAANLGVAIGIGQVVFAVALVALLLRA